MRNAEKQRTERIVAHVTKFEYSQFSAMCERKGVSLSTGLRMLVMQEILQQEKQTDAASMPLAAGGKGEFEAASQQVSGGRV